MVTASAIGRRQRYFLASISILFLLFAAGCGGGQPQPGHSELKMAAMEGMPEEVRAAPVTVQEAYQFAAANPDILSQLPCYCGCGAMGHNSNLDCYLAGEDTNGSIAYDPHALGCSICVDITQDTMRLLQEGKTIQQIRAYVDQTYAQYGPSNMP